MQSNERLVCQHEDGCERLIKMITMMETCRFCVDCGTCGHCNHMSRIRAGGQRVHDTMNFLSGPKSRVEKCTVKTTCQLINVLFKQICLCLVFPADWASSNNRF